MLILPSTWPSKMSQMRCLRIVSLHPRSLFWNLLINKSIQSSMRFHIQLIRHNNSMSLFWNLLHWKVKCINYFKTIFFYKMVIYYGTDGVWVRHQRMECHGGSNLVEMSIIPLMSIFSLSSTIKKNKKFN